MKQSIVLKITMHDTKQSELYLNFFNIFNLILDNISRIYYDIVK